MNPHDSADLRSHGAQLRAAAEAVRAVADRLERRIESTDFRGPAATRFNAGMSERLQRLRRTASDLQDLADIVVQDASAPTA